MSKYNKGNLMLELKKIARQMLVACQRYHEEISKLLFHDESDKNVVDLPDMQEELSRHVMPAMRFGLGLV